MRKLVLAVVGVLVVALLVDFGAAITTEYRISRAVRHSADLKDDPEVTVGGFPFLSQVGTGRIDSMTIRAREVPSRTVGKLIVEATFSDIDLPRSGMTVSPDETVTIGRTDADLVISQTYLGQMLGVPDLEMSAPPADSSDGTGGSGGVGLISGPAISPRKVLLTGTVETGHTESGKPIRQKVAVLVHLVLDGEQVHIIPDEVRRPSGGPAVTDDDEDEPDIDEVGAPFATTIRADELPFSITPTEVHARGSELVISGRGEDTRVRMADVLTIEEAP